MEIITTEEIRAHVASAPIIAAVEAAFRAFGKGESDVFPVTRGTGSDPNHIVAIKSGRDGAAGLIGVKVAGYNPANKPHGRDAHSSTTLLIDDATSEVIAVVEAGYLNGLRTAAANAVAVRHLARANARTLGIIGTGAQGVFEVEAVAAVRPIETVIAASRSPGTDGTFERAVFERTGLEVQFADRRELVERSDVLVTVTPSVEALFEARWVRPGTHISAMGSDNVGKRELPLDIFERGNLIMDHPPQSMVLGEAQHIVAAGMIGADVLSRQSLGALLNGEIVGRASAQDITIFDSSGLSIQDIAAAKVAVELVRAARGNSVGQRREGDN